MPRITHDQVRNMGDVQLSYKFNMKFTKIPSNVTGNAEDLNVRCQSSTLPTKSITDIPIEVHGHKTHQNGKGTYSDSIELVFFETVDNKVKEFMRTWRELSSTVNTGATKTKKESEATVYLELLGTDDKVIWTYTLTGCLYREGTIGTLDGSSDEAIKPNLNMTYDYFTDKKVA